MLAVICSMEAVVSSTLAACSEDDWERDWAVAETWPEALLRASEAVVTSPMMLDSLPTILLMAVINWPTSSLESASILTVRSPLARESAALTATLIGRVMLRVTHRAKRAERITAATESAMIRVFVWLAISTDSAPVFSIDFD